MTLSVDDILGRYFVTSSAGQSLATGGWLTDPGQGPQMQFLTQADADAAVATYVANGGSESLTVAFAQVPDGVLMNTSQAAMSRADRATRDAIQALMDRVATLETPAPAPAAGRASK